jgi:hypothetical protein
MSHASLEGGLPASVASAFDALAWEMELAGARCTLLDTAIGELVATLPAELQAKAIGEMHAVDLLSQQLAALSSFARKVGGQVSHDVAVDVHFALSDITLSAVADRMLAALGGKSQNIFEGEAAGELDLF